jgi:hypothetical protein
MRRPVTLSAPSPLSSPLSTVIPASNTLRRILPSRQLYRGRLPTPRRPVGRSPRAPFSGTAFDDGTLASASDRSSESSTVRACEHDSPVAPRPPRRDADDASVNHVRWIRLARDPGSALRRAVDQYASLQRLTATVMLSRNPCHPKNGVLTAAGPSTIVAMVSLPNWPPQLVLLVTTVPLRDI